MCACRHLQKMASPSQMHTIDLLHASRGPDAKKNATERSRASRILILCSTEVVGIVCTLVFAHDGLSRDTVTGYKYPRHG